MTLIYKGYLRMLTVLDYKLFMAGIAINTDNSNVKERFIIIIYS